MTDLQRKLLEMLRWFDHYCRENNLRYYAIGGTLLGAVRHNGFIPWDDDIDIGMPRSDYKKLAKLMDRGVFGKYLLETEYSEDKSYCYPFAKLYDKTTTLVENVHTGLRRGIYLDIFPIDGIGTSDKPDLRWYARIKKKYQLYLARITGVRKGRSLYKNAVVLVMRSIPNCIVDIIELRKSISRMCSRYSFEESTWAGNLVGNWWEKEIVPTSFFGKPKEYVFEGFTILGVEQADAYLTAIYGDWRKLPPKDRQVSHHDYKLCDLEHGYL